MKVEQKKDACIPLVREKFRHRNWKMLRNWRRDKSKLALKGAKTPKWLPNARIQSKLGIEEKNDNNRNPNIHKCHVWRMKVRISRANHAIQEERPKS